MSRKNERVALVVAALILSAITSLYSVKTYPDTRVEVRSVFTTPGYVPPASLFGLYQSWGTIESSYQNEGNLINGSQPVADTDLMLPTGWTEYVHLPVSPYKVNSKYTLLGTAYIAGSGWYETWRTPNGGYFAFLHLSHYYVSAPAAQPPIIEPPLIIPHLILKGEDRTYRHAKNFTGVKSGQSLNSGAVVGISGWPTDPQYGNGTSGPSNAHLCVVYDQRAKDWFYHVQYTRPAVFPQKTWDQYRVKHHKKKIPAYTRKSLNWIPSLWWHKNWYKRCAGVMYYEKWFPTSKKDGYERQELQGCIIFTWPHHGWYKLVRKRHASV